MNAAISANMVRTAVPLFSQRNFNPIAHAFKYLLDRARPAVRIDAKRRFPI
jgi:hypothetical protein